MTTEVEAPSVAYSAMCEILGFDHPYFLAPIVREGVELFVLGCDRRLTRWVMSVELAGELVWKLTEHHDVNHVMCRPFRRC